MLYVPSGSDRNKPTNQSFCTKRNLLTYGAEPLLRSCQLCSHSGTSQHFKEPKGSSPCSQEPSTGPCPEPDRSSPYHPILSLRSILILSTHLRLGLPNGLFPSGFPTNILYAFLVSPSTKRKLIKISVFLFLRGAELQSNLCAVFESSA
jgi:hypothetical protein